jgi:predicted Zn-dependent protease
VSRKQEAVVRNIARLTVAAAALWALAGCTQNPATGRSQLLFMSRDQEIAIGQSAAPELVTEYGGEVGSAKVRSYVNRVGRGLVVEVESEYTDLPWKFTVLESPVINAFALPGGQVFMSMGLLARCRNEAELAGVLGHEVGHVTAQHVDERVSHAMLLEMGVSVLGATVDSQLLVESAALFSNGYQLKFGRDQESEADILGVRYMSAAGYDPYGMLQVMEILKIASAGARQPEFLSTHPYPETRIKTITGLLEGDYAFTQDNPDFKRYRSRFERDLAPHLPDPQTLGDAGAATPLWCATCRLAATTATFDLE